MTCVRCSRELEVDSTFCRFCGAATSSSARKRLNRLPANGRIAGVCAGIASYFDVDVTLVRLAWVALSIVPGLFIGGIVAYIATWLLVPASESAGQPIYTGKRLIRSSNDRTIAGVCGGLGDYMGIDPTIVRIAFVILAIYPGAVVGGVLAYLIAWFIIPSAPTAPLQTLTTTV